MRMNALLLICCFLSTLPINSFAIDDDDKPDNKPQNFTQHGRIKLNVDLQKTSGIQTVKLTASTFSEEFVAHGKVINIQALLALRNRYQLVSAERNNIQAKLNQAEQNFNRQKELFANGASSKRNLQEQEAQWRSYQSQITGSDFQDKAIVNEATVLWGENLTAWALAKAPTQLNELLSHQEKLIQITLPSNKHLADDVKSIYIASSGDRSKAIKADYVSVAAQTEPLSQGESYFFKTRAKNILSGMNIMAWIPEKSENISGAHFPKAALIWYMNQAFVYQKTSAETFVRRPLLNYALLPDGNYLSQNLNPDDEIVIEGAQMLLSEEFKGQIPKEGDD